MPTATNPTASLADRYGPWAVIAGASEGTGRAFAQQLAAAGIHCILIARREQPLRALADEIRRDHGVDCVIASIDLSMPDACEQVKAAVGDREVGLFIANAGADPNGARFLDRSAGILFVAGHVKFDVGSLQRSRRLHRAQRRDDDDHPALVVASAGAFAHIALADECLERRVGFEHRVEMADQQQALAVRLAGVRRDQMARAPGVGVPGVGVPGVGVPGVSREATVRPLSRRIANSTPAD